MGKKYKINDYNQKKGLTSSVSFKINQKNRLLPILY